LVSERTERVGRSGKGREPKIGSRSAARIDRGRRPAGPGVSASRSDGPRARRAATRARPGRESRSIRRRSARGRMGRGAARAGLYPPRAPAGAVPAGGYLQSFTPWITSVTRMGIRDGAGHTLDSCDMRSVVDPSPIRSLRPEACRGMTRSAAPPGGGCGGDPHSFARLSALAITSSLARRPARRRSSMSGRASAIRPIRLARMTMPRVPISGMPCASAQGARPGRRGPLHSRRSPTPG
jgi:hypothetical protein